MNRVVYLGDEAQAAAWRLAGASVQVVAADGNAASCLRQWLRPESSSVDLILLAASVAARIPTELLDRTRAALTPLLLVLPDSAELSAGSELRRSVRRQLGMES